jgi:hypothetical protein
LLTFSAGDTSRPNRFTRSREDAKVQSLLFGAKRLSTVLMAPAAPVGQSIFAPSRLRVKRFSLSTAPA